MFEKISVCDRQSREGQTEEETSPSELFFEISTEDPLETKLGFERITWSLFSKIRSHHKNGSPSKAIRLQSSGSLFVIRGRTIYYVDGLVSKIIPFEICLDDAQTIESFQGKKTPGSNEFEAVLRNQSRITIIATNFPKKVCPISNLTLTFVIGEHYSHDTGCRPVLLCKGQIEMDDTVKSYIPGSKPEGVQHLFDHITLLSTQIDLPVETKKDFSSIILKKHENSSSFDYLSELPNVLLKIFILTVLLGIIWQPLGFIILPNIPTQHMWILSIVSYVLHSVRAVLLFVMLLLFFLTPMRSDILQDIPLHFCAHLRSLFNLSESSGGRMSFYVHGWNAWGFCGTVKQGRTIPLYAMPHVCVRAFHSGGPAFDINFGRGTDARTRRKTSLPAQDREDRSYARDRRDYIASDMFAVLADTVEKKGVVCGFLGQKEQFGCIAVNRAYDHMSVHLDCDGAVCSPKGTQGPESSQEVACTDWLYIELLDRVREDPLASYLEMAGKMNGTDKLFHSSTCSSNEGNMIASASPALPLDNIKAKEGITADQLNMVNAVRNRGGDEDEDLEEGVLLQLLHSKAASALLSTVRHKVPAGWCSWYHFFEFVSEKDLMDNISAMLSLKVGTGMHADRMDFKLFQVDDGYQRAWGDWMQLHLARFPSQSMTLIVDKIKEASMTPGLWMAPFACDKHSRVAADHPDWVLKRPATLLDFKGKDEGVPANSANCGKWFYGLDVTNPSVRTHITSCITTATTGWKFEYLKLDFLYAAALKDAHESYFDKSKTRAQAMQVGLSTIAEAMGPSVFLLGCGAPMGSVLGYVHANRVSSDAGLSWLPDLPLPFYDKWNLPCARNMVRNSVCRMMMHGRWWINDPDCILLRNTTHYTDREIIGIATVKAMSGGSFIISDDLATVSPGRMRVAQQLLPASNISAVPLDLLDREMPELLRLQLGKHRGPQGAISASAGSHVISCLNDWTVFGNCNWGERRKRNQVSAEYLNLMPSNSMSSSKKASQSSSSGNGSGSDVSRHRKEDKSKAVQSNIIDASYSSQTKAETVSEAEEGEGREQDFFILHVLEFWSSTYSYRLISSEHDSLSLSSTQSKEGLQAGKRRLIGPKDDLGFPAVEPHTASLYALRLTPYNSPPLYVGSNLHFTSGLEVTSFSYVMGPDRVSNPDSQYLEKQELSNSCTIRFEHCAVRCQQWTGYVWLYLPYRDARSSKGGRGKVPLPVLEGALAGCGGPELVESTLSPDSRMSRSSTARSSGNEGSEDSLIGGRTSRGADVSGGEGEGEGEEGGRLLGRVWRVPVASPGHDENDELIVFW